MSALQQSKEIRRLFDRSIAPQMLGRVRYLQPQYQRLWDQEDLTYDRIAFVAMLYFVSLISAPQSNLNIFVLLLSKCPADGNWHQIIKTKKFRNH